MKKFSDYLLNGIAQKDVWAVRGALNGYIDSDPAFKTGKFEEAVSYAQKRGIKVYEAMNKDFPLPEGCASEDLFFELRASLQENYAKERIDALKRVGRACMGNAKVYEETGSVKEKVQKKRENRKQQEEEKKGDRQTLKKDFHQHQVIVFILAAMVVLVGTVFIAVFIR